MTIEKEDYDGYEDLDEHYNNWKAKNLQLLREKFLSFVNTRWSKGFKDFKEIYLFADWLKDDFEDFCVQEYHRRLAK